MRRGDLMKRQDIERRMYKRVDVEVGLRYLLPLETFDQVHPASTADIGTGGLGLEVSEPMMDGTALIIELRPEACGIEQEPIRLQAQCIWCEPINGKYKVGIMFYYFDEGLRTRMSTFVEAVEKLTPQGA